MPNPIELKTPDAQFIYQFDWNNELASNVTLQSVSHSAPRPLTILEEQIDIAGGTSLLRLSGGTHGGVYVVTALAQLSDGEVVPGRFTLRVMQPPNALDSSP